MRKIFLGVLAVVTIGYSLFVGYYIIKKNSVLGQTAANKVSSESISTAENEPKKVGLSETEVESTSTLQGSVIADVVDYSALGLQKEAYVDSKEGFSIHLPEGWYRTTEFNSLIFAARIDKNSKYHPSLIKLVKVSTDLNSQTVLTAPVKKLVFLYDVKIISDSIIMVQDKQVRTVEIMETLHPSSGDITTKMVYYFFVKNGQLYKLEAFTYESSWLSYKDTLKASLMTFTLK